MFTRRYRPLPGPTSTSLEEPLPKPCMQLWHVCPFFVFSTTLSNFEFLTLNSKPKLKNAGQMQHYPKDPEILKISLIKKKVLANQFLQKKKSAILLVLLFKEINLLPEVSSPHFFRIQGSSMGVTDGWTDGQNRRRTDKSCV